MLPLDGTMLLTAGAGDEKVWSVGGGELHLAANMMAA